MRPLIAALFFLAGPALAETPMTGDEFDANTVGETLTYDYGDGLFGTE